MKRFIEGEDRGQASLLPASLEDYVEEDNPARVIDAFIEELDLGAVGFSGVVPEATGRPGYHPATLLKLYLYGYLNRIQSSRRLERESQRNIELMWLTGRLMPDFKTIADFRRDNGRAIQAACSQFIVLCRELGLFASAVVAIDGSKFKGVNNRDKNFTVHKVKKRIEQVEMSIARYLAELERADREDSDVAEAKTERISEKIEGLRRQMRAFKAMERQVEASPDKQVSLTDPDARSMATSGKGTGTVGYNVQFAVDTEHHLIVAHEVTKSGTDRAQLTPMGGKAREAMGQQKVTVLADKGYYNRDEVQACAGTGIVPLIPKTHAFDKTGHGRFTTSDFVYDAEHDRYTCPAGKHLTKGKVRSDRRGNTDIYSNPEACKSCPLKSRCTPERLKRVKRMAGEEVLEEMQARLERMPDAMAIRRETVEHPFATLKAWMGTTPFLMKRLKNVRTEMALSVLAYNIKRMINIFGTKRLISAISG